MRITRCAFFWGVVPVMFLTCMFVVRMCFLTLVTASLLQEEGSTLHHEEALTQAAKKQKNKNGTEALKASKHRHYMLSLFAGQRGRRQGQGS